MADELTDIKFSLTIEQIEELLIALDAQPIRRNGILMCRTICHGGESHKLYYYDNTKLFRCYTECDDGYFDLYALIQKVNNKLTLPQAISFVKQFFGIYTEYKDFQQDLSDDWKILNRYAATEEVNEQADRRVELQTYDGNFLRFLPHPRILPWEQEGIKLEIIKRNNICYNPSSEAIVIPHYDINDKLVGIRERTLIKENEQYGKYKPMFLNKKMYNHPLGFNLFNINNSKEHIKQQQRAILFEGEKSPLLYASYFGVENDITVACCGNNLSSYQFKLLLSLGIKELTIAFDKQFKTIGDDEWKSWKKKLEDLNKKYGKDVNINFIFDKWNMLDYKDSPIDKGKQTFINLWQRRFRI